MTFGGLAFDLWQTIDEGSTITCAHAGEEVHLSIGVSDAWLNLTFTEEGVAALVAAVSEVLDR
ncbi:hypothetical protein [Amycolatopsis aidingensis]|uniref:hypothetical protein n=1 Tax=Amycolatopsis aidingensis TaxID=2842453 RepID=UPI001C0E3E7C|nr:hypothetical protein [Amycolatopsis aidingensis]